MHHGAPSILCFHKASSMSCASCCRARALACRGLQHTRSAHSCAETSSPSYRTTMPFPVVPSLSYRDAVPSPVVPSPSYRSAVHCESCCHYDKHNKHPQPLARTQTWQHGTRCGRAMAMLLVPCTHAGQVIRLRVKAQLMPCFVNLQSSGTQACPSIALGFPSISVQ